MPKELSDRYYASVPADDPRFAELREVLMGVRQTGRYSPASRMLGEWALLGFLLTTGRLSVAATTVAIPAPSDELPDLRELLAAKHQLETAAAQLGGFDE